MRVSNKIKRGLSSGWARHARNNGPKKTLRSKLKKYLNIYSYE